MSARPGVPPSASTAGVAAVAWHPPQAVLELTELAATGVIPAVPADALRGLPGGGEPVVIEDAEGTPVAMLAADGTAQQLRPFAHPPLRRRRQCPDDVRAATAGRTMLAVAVTGPLTAAQVTAAREAAEAGTAGLVWLVVTGDARPGPRDGGLSPEGLWRAVRALAGATDVAVPIALPAGYDELLDRIGAAYADGWAVPPQAASVAVPDRAAGDVHPAFAAELARAHPPASRRGLVIFFTGLSGSGKSTLAKALAEDLQDDGRRSVSLLDGDEVRRLLSAGLGFSAADRDANISRIGFVAAEIARHGGTAVCAPIAPFAAVRAEVRVMVEQAGGDLVLVHVATPLAECERRDRKGLYARARRGEIAEFTGISAPYEPPEDADLVLDTTDTPVPESLGTLWRLLQERGYLAEDAG